MDLIMILIRIITDVFFFYLCVNYCPLSVVKLNKIEHNNCAVFIGTI